MHVTTSSVAGSASAKPTLRHTGHVDDDLVKMLTEQPLSCRLWPEQVEGPYFRDVHLDRRNIVEDRAGLPLRVGLRLLDASTEQPLIGDEP
jgi:hypothetical protein